MKSDRWTGASLAARSIRSPTARAKRGRKSTALCASRERGACWWFRAAKVPVDVKMAEDRAKKTRAGHLVRMLNIPAERAFGVFDHPGPDGDAASFAKQCKLAAATAYGTGGPEFVRRPS